MAMVYTVAFEGVEARLVEVQAQCAPGLPGFSIVGLPDKAVSEARDRIRSAFHAMSIALPARKITVNLSPAGLPKEGSHYDLPIALAILAALEVIPLDQAEATVCLGELALDGRLVPVPGALPAALAAAEEGRALICPAKSGPEAAWIVTVDVFGLSTLRQTVDHLTGRAPCKPDQPGDVKTDRPLHDLAHVRGQERAKRALEIAAAGRHHMLMTGPPGAGKSMIAACLPGLLPPLTPTEALELAMVNSLSGQAQADGLCRAPPYRAPHHTASMAALVGGGRGAAPGEISLAHNGVLFLDELPEFARNVLETLRQPIETSEILVSRANAHLRYPARFLMVAAANPCRCGYLADAARSCSKAPKCGTDYFAKISGPLLDRIDIRIDLPAITMDELQSAPRGETSEAVAMRVERARALQLARYADTPHVRLNADAGPDLLDDIAGLDDEGRRLMSRAADRFGLTARGYHRIQRVARSIADLDDSESIAPRHLAEAISYRLPPAA